MKRRRSFFCWFIGGLTFAGVAVAATSPTGSPTPPPLSIVSASDAQTIKSEPSTVQTQAPATAPKQSSEIWECTTNGVKTFSSKPCGRKSSLVSLRPINTMKPTPVTPSARADGPDPRDTTEYTDQSSYPDQTASSAGFGEGSYPADQGYRGYVYAPIFRSNHHHRPEHHHDPSPRPHHPAPKPHNAAPPTPMQAPRGN